MVAPLRRFRASQTGDRGVATARVPNANDVANLKADHGPPKMKTPAVMGERRSNMAPHAVRGMMLK